MKESLRLVKSFSKTLGRYTDAERKEISRAARWAAELHLDQKREIERFEQKAAAKSKEEAKEEGVKIAKELIDAVKDSVAGVHVSSPFGFIKTALKVLL